MVFHQFLSISEVGPIHIVYLNQFYFELKTKYLERKIKNPNNVNIFWGKYLKVQIKYLQNESLYGNLFLLSLFLKQN
jgi:hypothetical protein